MRYPITNSSGLANRIVTPKDFKDDITCCRKSTRTFLIFFAFLMNLEFANLVYLSHTVMIRSVNQNEFTFVIIPSVSYMRRYVHTFYMLQSIAKDSDIFIFRVGCYQFFIGIIKFTYIYQLIQTNRNRKWSFLSFSQNYVCRAQYI